MRHRLSDISTYGLMANGKEMNTLPTLLQRSMVQFTLTFYSLSSSTGFRLNDAY